VKGKVSDRDREYTYIYKTVKDSVFCGVKDFGYANTNICIAFVYVIDNRYSDKYWLSLLVNSK